MILVIGVVVDLGPILSGPWGCRTAIVKYRGDIVGIKAVGDVQSGRLSNVTITKIMWRKLVNSF